MTVEQQTQAETLMGSDDAQTQTPETPPTNETVNADQTQAAQQETTQTNQSQEPKTSDEVPEKYEFKPVGENEIAPDVLEHFSEVAKELGLSQEKAQLVLDKMAPVLHARQTEQLAELHNDWANQSRADKEFGGEKLNENLALAKQALETFGTPELKTLLNSSGLGNHPEVIRFCVRAGKSLSEDTVLKGGTTAPNHDGKIAFYNKSDMK